MRLASIALLFLCGCGGGGGGGSATQPPNAQIGLGVPFVPSANIESSHPWLFANWVGRSRSDRGGPFVLTSLRMFPFVAQPRPDALVAVLSGIGGGEGECYANGRSAFVLSRFNGFSHTSILMNMSDSETKLTGRYEIYYDAVSMNEPFESGTLELDRVNAIGAELPSSLTITETYTEPGLLLQVVTKVR